MRRFPASLICALFVTVMLLCLDAQGAEATLYRDTWGVPHIYADTLADAAYVLGYAQAEDRLEDIYKNIRTAIGTMAEVFGPDYAEMDYALQMVKNAETCEKYWQTAPEHIRALGDNFMRGVEAYVAEHPEKKPEYAIDLYGWHCATIGRAMVLQWPLGTIMDDLKNKKNAPPFGSNAFAVAPSRAADGCAILMTDPHLTWEGLAVFYEARVHAGGHDVCGFWLAGAPLPALVHNAHVAWACTTGGPDTSDCYMVKLNPKNPFQYEYNGEWLTADMKMIAVKVKGGAPQMKPAFYTIHGPLVEEPDLEKGIAYCGATPYWDQAGMFEQMYDMTTARNADEFYKAVGMNQLMEQNILWADTEGTIQYVRSGRAPIRPEGFNWSAPVPGDTDAAKWLGIHDIKDLVQIKNPPQGYFQNCNVSPQNMMNDSPLTPDKYKEYLYNVTWDFNSPRGARLLELLAADDSVTKDDAMAYTLNVYDILAKPWQNALKAAVDAVGAPKMSNPEFADAANAILAWDGQFTVDTTVGPIVRFWRLKCEKVIDIIAVADEKPLSKDDQTRLLDLLEETLAEIKAKYGSLEVKWGDINLIGRGGKYFPCPGADFGKGPGKRNLTETVMDVAAREEPAGSGKYVGYNGTSSVLLSFLHKDGIDSYSLLNWGQSADPGSAHYVDQAEKLYSTRTFKPTWFKKEDLLRHLESQKTLSVP